MAFNVLRNIINVNVTYKVICIVKNDRMEMLRLKSCLINCRNAVKIVMVPF